MAFIHGRVGRLLLGTVVYSVYMRGFERGTEIENADTTVYGSEGHNFIAGLENGTLSLDGFLDKVATAGSQDAVADGALQAAAGTVITAAAEGLALGARVFMIEARATNYAISAPVGDSVSFNASWVSEGQVDHGLSLTAGVTSTTGGVGSADSTSIDNAASSSGGLAASLHVPTNTRNGTTTFIVQHSVDNSTFVDLITFTVVNSSTTASEKKAVTGTVNRYVRARATRAGTTGTVSYFIAAARR